MWKPGKRAVPMRTLLFVVSLLILLSALLFSILIRWYIGNVTRETEKLLSLASDEYGNGILKKYDNYITGQELIGLDQTIRDNIFRTDVRPSEMMDLGKQLKKIVDSLTYFFYQSGEVYSYRLYTYLPGDGSYFFNLDSIREEWWFQKMQRERLSSFSWYSYSSIAATYQLNIVRSVTDFGSSVSRRGAENCYQCITINLNALFSLESEVFRGESAEIYVFERENGVLVYKNGNHGQEAAELFAAMPEDGYSDTAAVRVQGDQRALTMQSRRLDSMNATVLLLFTPSRLDAQGVLSETLSAAGIVLVFLLLLSFLVWFYLNYHSRLEYVIRNIDGFDENSPKAFEALKGDDEVARIDRHVIRMQERIRTLIQREYTAKMQMLAAQMEALTICVNPHFLYNTLGSISAMACMEEADRTVEMVDALSGMFRYSCDTREKLVPLRSEIKNISDYLYIQKQRYQEGFSCSVKIPEAFFQLYVPKLILQPVVENSFKHGFSGGKEGRKELSVTAEHRGKRLFLLVQDNGSGISPDTMERLRQEQERDELPEGDAVRIGLFNVHRRIRMMCGQGYGLKLYSMEGEYTRVELCLPAWEEKDGQQTFWNQTERNGGTGGEGQ